MQIRRLSKIEVLKRMFHCHSCQNLNITLLSDGVILCKKCGHTSERRIRE